QSATQYMFTPTEPSIPMYPVTHDRLERAKRYARYAAAAYCVSKRKIRSWSCVIHHIMRPVRVVRVFEPFCTAARGYVAVDELHKEIVVAFRGTLVLQNALHDLRVVPTPFKHGA